jgi:hypothetical protein
MRSISVIDAYCKAETTEDEVSAHFGLGRANPQETSLLVLPCHGLSIQYEGKTLPGTEAKENGSKVDGSLCLHNSRSSSRVVHCSDCSIRFW